MRSFRHVVRGEFDLAEQFDENLLRLSHQPNDLSVSVFSGYHSTGRTLFCRGRFASSRSHQEEALTLLDPLSEFVVGLGRVRPSHRIGYFRTCHVLVLGFPDQALARSDAAIAEAREAGPSAVVGRELGIGVRLLSLVGDDAILGEW